VRLVPGSQADNPSANGALPCARVHNILRFFGSLYWVVLHLYDFTGEKLEDAGIDCDKLKLTTERHVFHLLPVDMIHSRVVVHHLCSEIKMQGDQEDLCCMRHAPSSASAIAGIGRFRELRHANNGFGEEFIINRFIRRQ